MEFCHSFPFVTFVVLTVDQFVERGDGLHCYGTGELKRLTPAPRTTH